MTEQKNNNNMQMGVIVALLLVIAVMGFFLGKNSAGTNGNNNAAVSQNYEDLTITVINDARCGEKCPADLITEQLKQLPSVTNAEIITKDFSDEGVSDYLKENNIGALPLFVFSTNNFDVSADPIQMDPQTGQPAPKLNAFLQAMGDEFFLPVGASFNPFQERSERGFLKMDLTKLQAIKDASYIEGNTDATITWLEYSDLECPYCAKLHNSDTPEALKEKYGSDLNKVFNHFPLGFHANAQTGAEILECLGEQKGSEAFYSLIVKSYKEEKSDKSYLIDQAVALGADEDELNTCLDEGRYTTKVQDEMNAGAELFGITGTPGNVLINNTTGEYEVLSGAYPTASFEEIIDSLK